MVYSSVRKELQQGRNDICFFLSLFDSLLENQLLGVPKQKDSHSNMRLTDKCELSNWFPLFLGAYHCCCSHIPLLLLYKTSML